MNYISVCIALHCSNADDDILNIASICIKLKQTPHQSFLKNSDDHDSDSWFVPKLWDVASM